MILIIFAVDGPNGLRFNTSLAAGDVAGSPAQSQTDRIQQTINPSKAVFTIEPSSSKVSRQNILIATIPPFYSDMSYIL